MPRTKEKVKEKVEIVDNNNTLEEKPYFFPRLLAFIIDVLVINAICFGVLLLVPKNENYSKYTKESEAIQIKKMELMQKDDLTKEDREQITQYNNQLKEIAYDIDYNNVLSILIEIVIMILYFIVFQFYNKGKTIGKKLMKLKVISVTSEELTLNQVAIRALITDSILVNMLIVGSLLFINRDYYFYASSGLGILAYIVLVTTLFMILFRKDGRGLHDIVAGTKVVQER